MVLNPTDQIKPHIPNSDGTVNSDYPLGNKPSGQIAFYGYQETSVSSLTPSITLQATPDMLPKAVIATASGTSGVGSRRLSSKLFKPYEHVFYRWRLEFQNGDPVPNNEGIVDQRNSTARNPYTEQIGPEFTGVVREGGAYRLHCDAYHMTAVEGDCAMVTTYVDFSVSENAHNNLFYDQVIGDDANDGLHPHNLELTNASYTESTKELTQVGGFANYDHAAATAGDATGWFNYVHITTAGFVGLWRIASKTNNDTVVLETGLGSDQTGLTSSNGPKQNYAGGNAANDTIYHFSGNGQQSVQVYNPSTVMRQHFSGNEDETATPTAVGYRGYHGKPVITATSTTAWNIGSGGSNDPPSSVWFYNLDVDCDGNGEPMFAAQTTALTNGTTQTFLFDNCIFRRSSTGTAGNIQFAVVGGNVTHLVHYRTTWDGREADTARGSNRHALFSKIDGTGWQRALACTFHTDSDNLILDHFWYPTGSMVHFHCHWCDFDESVTGTSYCINTNNGITGSTSQYLSIVENNFGANAEWGVDFSNSNNQSDDKTFDNVYMVGNKSTVTRGFTLNYALEGGFIAYNDISKANTTDSAIWCHCAVVDNATYDVVATGNRNYGARTFNVDDGQHFEGINNTCHQPAGAAAVAQVDEVDLGVGNDIVLDKNNFYAVDGAEITVDGSGVALATYNTTYSVNNASNDPSWNDPANGDFDGQVNQGYAANLV